MANVGTLSVKVIADIFDFDREIRKVKSRLTETQKLVQDLSKIKISAFLSDKAFKPGAIKAFNKHVESLGQHMAGIMGATDKMSKKIAAAFDKVSSKAAVYERMLRRIAEEKERIRKTPMRDRTAATFKSGAGAISEMDTTALKQYKVLLADIKNGTRNLSSASKEYHRILDNANKRALRGYERQTGALKRLNIEAKAQLKLVKIQERVAASTKKNRAETARLLAEYRKLRKESLLTGESQGSLSRRIKILSNVIRIGATKDVRKYREELKRLQRASEQLSVTMRQAAASTQTTGGGFGSAKWIKERALWFVQLRGYWEVYRGVLQALGSVVKFNVEMTNLLAITKASTEEMDGLEEAIRKAAVETKFYAADVAAVATVLAQAGFVAKEVANIIPTVALLATATNREMAESGELMTTILKAWRLEASMAPAVANTLAAGVNSARIQIEDLNTALSYTSTVFANMGVSLERAVSFIAVLREAGIQPSQAGTAGRRIAAEFAKVKPSKRMIDALREVGLEWRDISSHANSLDESLRKLKASGISFVEVLGMTGTRTGAVLGALIQGIDVSDKLTEKMTGTNEAVRMAAVQMKSFGNQMKQAWSKVEDISIALTKAGKSFEWFGEVVQAVITIVGGLVLAMRLTYDTVTETYAGIDKLIKNFGENYTKVLAAFWKDGWDAARAAWNEGFDGLAADITETKGKLTKLWNDYQADVAKLGWGAKPGDGRATGLIDFWVGPPGEIKPGKSGLGDTPELPEDAAAAQANARRFSNVLKKRAELIAKYQQQALKQRSTFARAEMQREVRDEIGERARALKLAQAGIEGISRRGGDRLSETKQQQLVIEGMQAQEKQLKSNMATYEAARKKSEALMEVYGDEKYKNDVESYDKKIKDLTVSISVMTDKLSDFSAELLKTPWDKFKDGVAQANVEFTDFKAYMETAGGKLTGMAQTGLTNIVGGTLFPDEGAIDSVKSKMRDLNAELNEYKQEKADITAGRSLFSEDEAQEINELNDQIDATTRALEAQSNAFDDLADPIERAKQAFKDFADSIIDEIKNIIARLIAMYIWQTMTGFFFPSGGAKAGSAISVGGSAIGPNTTAMMSGATGGVFPNFKNIRKLGRGGVTSGASMALLGDNKSGTELVIPSENIRKDSVSGYTRDSEGGGDIVIANIVDSNMMMSALAGAQGKRVVLNHISADIINRGPSYHIVKGVR